MSLKISRNRNISAYNDTAQQRHSKHRFLQCFDTVGWVKQKLKILAALDAFYEQQWNISKLLNCLEYRHSK